MVFEQKDIVYHHYKWTELSTGDPRISGLPDDTLFDRNEGYEVLYLINCIMNQKKYTQVSTGKRIEKMIKLGIPGPVQSQLQVKNWIINNL